MKPLHKNLFVAGQLNAEDFAQLKQAGVDTIINNRPDNEEPGQLGADTAAKLAAENGLKYHYLPMANGQPLPAGLVEEFRSILKESDGTVLAHCRSGMRSSFIWALGAVSAGELSVDETIDAAQAAGIPLNNARSALEAIADS